jgi:hypothetical protein
MMTDDKDYTKEVAKAIEDYLQSDDYDWHSDADDYLHEENPLADYDWQTLERCHISEVTALLEELRQNTIGYEKERLLALTPDQWLSVAKSSSGKCRGRQGQRMTQIT